MSPTEIAWRVRSVVRDAIDRPRVLLGLYPAPKNILSGEREEETPPGFHVSGIQTGEWRSSDAGKDETDWCQQLVRRADQITRHRLNFFDLRDQNLGDPIDWNRDHGSGKRAPMGYSQSINYRDFRVTGDCKFVWEPNRHHQLVVLGRAYRASGDLRYAAAIVEQLDSWLQQCPFGKGMNWRSPLELGIRLINWVWAIDLIRDSGFFTGEFRARVLHAVYLHLWEITRKYSRGSSANNHLIGEAAGVFIATSYFRELANASRWREESREMLSREIIAQTYPDGCTREQAFGYHLFVFQFFLISGLVVRWIGEDFPPSYWSQLEKMLEFAGALTEGGGEPPMFGDCDDGYVLDLGDSHHDVRDLLSIGAIVFGRSDFKAWAGRYLEPARWFLGHSSREKFNAIPHVASDTPLESHVFIDSGYYLLQCGKMGESDRVSILFDCGDLGFKSIAAHGHADALSFTLRVFGVDVFVDPGTYDYFSFPVWRKYFRSTRAHNTVVVDGADQSVIVGPFMWGARAKARCIRWEPRVQGGTVTGEHDGYTRLSDPVTHRRTINLDGPSRTITIWDEIMAQEAHEVVLYFHLSESCSLSKVGSNRYEITVGGETVTLEMDPGLSVDTLTGSEEPIGGWVSRGYHQKIPTATIIARSTCHGSGSFVCRVTF